MEDERYYDMVLEELKRGEKREGLWLKALTVADGDQTKAKTEYVRLRVAQLVEENREEQKKTACRKNPAKYRFKLMVIGFGVGIVLSYVGMIMEPSSDLENLFRCLLFGTWLVLPLVGFFIGCIIDEIIQKRTE